MTKIFFKMWLYIVKKEHPCDKCGKFLMEGDKIFETYTDSYCLKCGYYFAKKITKQWTNNLLMIEKKYMKDIIADRLTK